MTQESAAPSSPPDDGQVCGMAVVDIAEFTKRNEATQLYLHERLYEILPTAFNSAGIPWDNCFYQDRGDGTLVVLPPGISAKGLIDRCSNGSASSSQAQLLQPRRGRDTAPRRRPHRARPP
jgi:hypothetical protein